jgi:hypothetical protein
LKENTGAKGLNHSVSSPRLSKFMAHWAEIAVKFNSGIFSNQNTVELEMPLLGQYKA